MKLYLSVIGVTVAIVAAANGLLGAVSPLYAILSTLWCTVLVVLLDGAIALAVNKLPDGWFGVDNRLYYVTEREVSLYKRLGVKRWKEKVIDLGGIGGFSKGKIADPYNPEYIKKYIVECNKGVLTHRLIYPIGFLIMLPLPNICALTVALPIAAVNLFLNVLPTVALRYNTPKLKAIYGKLVARRKSSGARKIF